MLAAGLAEILEPHALPARLRGDLTAVTGLDGAGADALLTRLPDRELEQRHNGAPTTRTMLTMISAHPQLTGLGYLVGPDRGDEGISLTGLVLDDPDLLTFVPDIVAGPLPRLMQHLDERARAEYLDHRAACIEGSVRRQQWYAGRHRYELGDAFEPPTEITEIQTVGGWRLRLWWT